MLFVPFHLKRNLKIVILVFKDKINFERLSWQMLVFSATFFCTCSTDEKDIKERLEKDYPGQIFFSPYVINKGEKTLWIRFRKLITTGFFLSLASHGLRTFLI